MIQEETSRRMFDKEHEVVQAILTLLGDCKPVARETLVRTFLEVQAHCALGRMRLVVDTTASVGKLSENLDYIGSMIMTLPIPGKY